MAIYSGKDMPKEVGRTTMDFEVEEWLKDCPVLGSHEPIHVQRAAHDRLEALQGDGSAGVRLRRGLVRHRRDGGASAASS